MPLQRQSSYALCAEGQAARLRPQPNVFELGGIVFNPERIQFNSRGRVALREAHGSSATTTLSLKSRRVARTTKQLSFCDPTFLSAAH
jgi:hypothetical protein